MQKQNEMTAIYNVRELGAGKTLVLGVQHTFAMFGATVLVPLLTGLDVSTTLLMAGLGIRHIRLGPPAPGHALNGVARGADPRGIRQFPATVWTNHESSSSFSQMRENRNGCPSQVSSVPVEMKWA